MAVHAPGSTVTTARTAMLRLAAHPAPYPAAATLSGAQQDTRQPSTSNRPGDVGSPTTARPAALSRAPSPPPPTTFAPPSEATTPTPPSTIDALRRTLAEFVDSIPWSNGPHPPAKGRNRTQRREAAEPSGVAPPRSVGLPAHLAQDHPGLASVLDQLGATRMECGATTAAPTGAAMANQRFYLALAAAVSTAHEQHHRVAGELRAQIEGAVRAARPNWATQDFLGQEVGAFADFLIWGIQAAPRLRARAVAVYQEQNGTCEIFRSFHQADRQSPILALWFTGPAGGQLGHYYWVQFQTRTPTLGQLLTMHRRGGGQGPRVPTITTDAVG